MDTNILIITVNLQEVIYYSSVCTILTNMGFHSSQSVYLRLVCLN